MKPMRKASRRQDAAWTLEVFDKAPYVTVSMTRPDGTPYGLHMSIVRKDKTTFYFHCADEGEKIDCLRHNPTVSVSAVSKCSPAEPLEMLRLAPSPTQSQPWRALVDRDTVYF